MAIIRTGFPAGHSLFDLPFPPLTSMRLCCVVGVPGSCSIYDQLCSAYASTNDGDPPEVPSHPDRRDRSTAIVAIEKGRDQGHYLSLDEKKAALNDLQA